MLTWKSKQRPRDVGENVNKLFAFQQCQQLSLAGMCFKFKPLGIQRGEDREKTNRKKNKEPKNRAEFFMRKMGKYRSFNHERSEAELCEAIFSCVGDEMIRDFSEV